MIADRHDMKYFREVQTHLSKCTSCRPADFLDALWARQTRERQFWCGVSKVTLAHVVRMYNDFLAVYPKTPENTRKRCTRFIVRAMFWDSKIQYSKYLTSLEVAEAVLHAATKTMADTQPKVRMYWPTTTYLSKYQSKKKNGTVSPKKVVNVTEQEEDNDDLFRAAATHKLDELRPYVGQPKALLEMLQVSRVMHA